MKKVTFILFVFLITYLSSFAQPVPCKWIANSNIGHSYANDVKADLEGNVYALGFFNEIQVEDIYFDAESNHFHMFLGKWDKEGNLIWFKNIAKGDDCRGLQLTVNNHGDVILLGSYYQSVNIMDSADYTATYGGAFLLKIDKFGNYAWSKKIHCSSGWLCDFSVAIDKTDNIFMTMSGGVLIEGDETIGKSKIIKMNGDGEIQWGKGTVIDISRVFNERSLKVDEKYIYLVGQFKDTIDFAQQTFISSYDKEENPFDGTIGYGHSLDGIVGQFDLEGNEINALHFKGEDEIQMRTISLLQNEDIIISGQYNDSLSVENEKLHGEKKFLALLDSDLALKKAKNYSSIHVISSVSQSNFIFMGGGGCSASCIELMDENLNFLQSVNFDNSNTHAEGIHALAYNAANNTLMAAGYYTDEAHFSNCQVMGSPTADQKFYTVSFEFDLDVNIEDNSSPEQEYTIYPNPTDSDIFWNLEESGRTNIETISIYDISGKKLEELTIKPSQRKITLSSYPDGIYWLQIQTSNGNTSIHKVAKM